MDGSSIFHGAIIKASGENCPSVHSFAFSKFSLEGMEVNISAHEFVSSPVLVVRGPVA